ncbi:MAG: hypothetical protein Q4E72_04745, partial [bacterium]|nr:hypothetical protein [bacterium]
LTADNTDKAAQIAALTAEIADKAAQIEALTADGADKQAQITGLTASNTDMTAQIAALSADVSDKAAQIAALTADITAKAAQIDTLTADSADKTAQIDALTASGADKEAQMAALPADGADKAAQIATLTADITAKAAQIDALTADAESRAAQIVALQAQLASQPPKEDLTSMTEGEYASTKRFISQLQQHDFAYYTVEAPDSATGYEKISFPVGHKLENGAELVYGVSAYFCDSNERMLLRVWNLISFEEANLAPVMELCNTLNAQWLMCKFHVDLTDCSVTVCCDVPLADVAEMGGVMWDAFDTMDYMLVSSLEQLLPYHIR